VSALTLDALIDARLAALAGRSDGALLGRRIELHPRIGSTNDRARELASQGEPEGTVVVAEEQTLGRGRAARSWHSAAGLGVYLSALLRPETAPSRAPMLGLMAAVAAREALSRRSLVPLCIKWPNDILAEDRVTGRRRKLAGILVEARTTPEAVRDLVVGAGVNVNHTHEDFPPDIAATATSLRILSGAVHDRAEVAAALIAALEEWYTLWKRRGEGPILEAFRSMAPDLEGRRVRVSDGAAVWVGTSGGLTSDGALRVRPDGSSAPREVRYGDVTRVEEA